MSKTIRNTTVEEAFEAAKKACEVFLANCQEVIKDLPLNEEAPKGLIPAANWLKAAIASPAEVTLEHPLCKTHYSEDFGGYPGFARDVEGEQEACKATRELVRCIARHNAVAP